MGSQRFQLDREDLTSIAKGFGIGLAGAILTYATEYFGNIDFGAYAPLIAAFGALLANVIRKWAVTNEAPKYVDLTQPEK